MRAFDDTAEIFFLAFETYAFVTDRRLHPVMALGSFMHAVRACFGACAAIDAGIGPGDFVFRHLVPEPGWDVFNFYS